MNDTHHQHPTPNLDRCAGAPMPRSASVLDDVERFVANYVAFPSDHALVAVVLWGCTAVCSCAKESGEEATAKAVASLPVGTVCNGVRMIDK